MILVPQNPSREMTGAAVELGFLPIKLFLTNNLRPLFQAEGHQGMGVGTHQDDSGHPMGDHCHLALLETHEY